MALLLSCGAIALFLTAALTDIRSRTIPNALVIALAVLGVVRIGVALAAGSGPAPAAMDLLAALAVFALGALAFGGGMLGGGDAKLLASGTLWLGSAGVAPYLIGTALAGGALAILYVAWHLISRPASRPGLPYAVAIAVGGVAATAGSLVA